VSRTTVLLSLLLYWLNALIWLNAEAFTQNEFRVTPYDPSQFAARNLADTYIQQR